MLECTGTYLVAEGEVDFGAGSSAGVIVVIIIVILLAIGGAVGAFLFIQSKRKQPVDVAQSAGIAPPSTIVTAPLAQPTTAAPAQPTPGAP